MPAPIARLHALILRRFGRPLGAIVLAVVCTAGGWAADDDYLSAISREAEKVEADAQPTLTESGEAAPSTDGGLNLQAFEDDLKTRYKGSYTFYQKLPKRTREEVFLEYRDGASMDEIRKKIMDRFLHQ